MNVELNAVPLSRGVRGVFFTVNSLLTYSLPRPKREELVSLVWLDNGEIIIYYAFKPRPQRKKN